jgi:hypothetical protein
MRTLAALRRTNRAVTDSRVPDMVTMQVPVPEHAPLQPAKLHPERDLARNVAVTPCVTVNAQSAVAQSPPSGDHALQQSWNLLPDLITQRLGRLHEQ